MFLAGKERIHDLTFKGSKMKIVDSANRGSLDDAAHNDAADIYSVICFEWLFRGLQVTDQ